MPFRVGLGKIDHGQKNRELKFVNACKVCWKILKREEFLSISDAMKSTKIERRTIHFETGR